jgi:hypothetical protein
MSSTLYFAERGRKQVIVRTDRCFGGNPQVRLTSYESGFGIRVDIEGVELTLEQWRQINQLFDPNPAEEAPAK